MIRLCSKGWLPEIVKIFVLGMCSKPVCSCVSANSPSFSSILPVIWLIVTSEQNSKARKLAPLDVTTIFFRVLPTLLRG